MALTFEQRIEQLKNQYTDKFVVVDANRPELKRFEGFTGTVKTVNMSGRALVQFDEYHLNIGWFDIALDYLKVIDQPLPKPEKKAEAKHEKPAAKAEAKPAPAKAAAAPAAKAEAPAGSKKMSPAEMIAAAKAAKGEAPAAKAEAAPKPAAEKPAAPKGKMTPAEMIAAAKAAKGGAPAPAAEKPAETPKAPPPPVAEKPAPEPEPEPEPAPAPVAKAEKVAEKPAGGKWPKLATNEEKIAWCREHDNKG